MGRPGSELCSPCRLCWAGRDLNRDINVEDSWVTRMMEGSPQGPGGEIKLALIAWDLGKVVGPALAQEAGHPAPSTFPWQGGEGGDGECQPTFPTSPEPAVIPAELGGISRLCLKWGDRAQAGARGCLPAWRSSAYPLLLQGRRACFT